MTLPLQKDDVLIWGKIMVDELKKTLKGLERLNKNAHKQITSPLTFKILSKEFESFSTLAKNLKLTTQKLQIKQTNINITNDALTDLHGDTNDYTKHLKKIRKLIEIFIGSYRKNVYFKD
jgi:hypothetical protein